LKCELVKGVLGLRDTKKRKRGYGKNRRRWYFSCLVH